MTSGERFSVIKVTYRSWILASDAIWMSGPTSSLGFKTNCNIKKSVIISSGISKDHNKFKRNLKSTSTVCWQTNVFHFSIPKLWVNMNERSHGLLPAMLLDKHTILCLTHWNSLQRTIQLTHLVTVLVWWYSEKPWCVFVLGCVVICILTPLKNRVADLNGTLLVKQQN